MIDWLNSMFPDVAGSELSLAGASLLATLYPIGILAAVLDVRLIAREPRRRVNLLKRNRSTAARPTRFGLFSRASAGMIAALALPAFVAIYPLAHSVATSVPIRGWGVPLVTLPGTLLVGALSAFLVELVWTAFQMDNKALTETYESDVKAAKKAVSRSKPNPRGSGRKRR